MQKKQRTTSSKKMKAPRLQKKARSKSSKVATMKGPTDYNVRFTTPVEYETVRKAALVSRQSVNQFMIAAALLHAAHVTHVTSVVAERVAG